MISDEHLHKVAPNNEFTEEEFNEARRRSGRNTVGHLMERIAARKLARIRGGGSDQEHAHGKMQLHL